MVIFYFITAIFYHNINFFPIFPNLLFPPFLPLYDIS